MSRNLPLPEPKPALTRLYNEDFPRGRTFPKTDEANLILKGWRTCPTQVGKPMVPSGLSSRSSSDDLIEAVKQMGFDVTPTIEKYVREPEEKEDSQVETPAENEPPTSQREVAIKTLEFFKESPAQLTDAELVELGKHLGLDVRANMKTDTLVDRIQSYLDTTTGD